MRPCASTSTAEVTPERAHVRRWIHDVPRRSTGGLRGTPPAARRRSRRARPRLRGGEPSRPCLATWHASSASMARLRIPTFGRRVDPLRSDESDAGPTPPPEADLRRWHRPERHARHRPAARGTSGVLPLRLRAPLHRQQRRPVRSRRGPHGHPEVRAAAPGPVVRRADRARSLASPIPPPSTRRGQAQGQPASGSRSRRRRVRRTRCSIPSLLRVGLPPGSRRRRPT